MTEINAEDGVDDEFFKVGRVLLHDFKTFTMKILFSGLRDHAVLHPVEVLRFSKHTITFYFLKSIHAFLDTTELGYKSI